MKVCFFGSYTNNDFNRILKKILQKQGIDIIECQEEIHGIGTFFKAYFKLFFRHYRLDYDLMIIPWRGIITFPLVKIIAKKPVVYFPFISIYQTLVDDRKIVKKKSLKAKLIHFIDKTACMWSDLIILESNEHINYFCQEYKLKKKSFRKLPFSVDESIFYPLPLKKQDKTFHVLFIGSYIPLHGIETIIEAANFLKNHSDINFILVGEGQTKPKIEQMVSKLKLTNIKFIKRVQITSLPSILEIADVCLGIFSANKKAQIVIPHKILIALGSKKPLITAESKAMHEIFLENKKNCIFVPPENPYELSNAILFLKNNPLVCTQLAENGLKNFKENFSADHVGKQFLIYLNKLISDK